MRVEAGVRAGQLNSATQAAGLAVPPGCHPAVGVAGLTLGGGLGWLVGKYAATCDHLMGAGVVTAEGTLLHASASENSDLFWTLRGGGGNFGIVTAMEYQAHPLDRVIGGVIAYRMPLTRFLRFYSGFMSEAPPELAVELNIILNNPLSLSRWCAGAGPRRGRVCCSHFARSARRRRI